VGTEASLFLLDHMQPTIRDGHRQGISFAFLPRAEVDKLGGVFVEPGPYQNLPEALLLPSPADASTVPAAIRLVDGRCQTSPRAGDPIRVVTAPAEIGAARGPAAELVVDRRIVLTRSPMS
jgi:hypothetical protein